MWTNPNYVERRNRERRLYPNVALTIGMIDLKFVMSAFLGIWPKARRPIDEHLNAEGRRKRGCASFRASTNQIREADRRASSLAESSASRAARRSRLE